MRRVLAVSGAIAALLLVAPVSAQAAVPTLGAVSATNVQGVSALLKGTVEPGGLPTTYRFEYIAQATYDSNLLAGMDGFTGAAGTPASAVASGAGSHPARAAIAALQPDSTYRYRLTATNASGPALPATGVFTTTDGFGFLPSTGGFAVSAVADGGDPASLAGSHPYQMNFKIGLNLGGEFEDQPGVPFADGDIRELRIEMPPGMIVNPEAVATCETNSFNKPRSSPFATSRSGEDCPDWSQVGTVEVQTSREGGQVRRFGVFNLDPAPGVPAQLGFAPFGSPIVLDTYLRADAGGRYALTLEARNFPQGLDIRGLDLVLWGTPWGASHNGERGNCLNEAEPGFPWAKCSVGTPLVFKPLAYLTLPSECTASLAFTARASAWQQPAEVSRQAVNRDSLGQPVAVESCASAPFDPRPVGLLTTKKASSASGFDFRLTNDGSGVTEPTLRAPSPVRGATVALPTGVTINPSVGSGLGVCTPAQYAAETASSAQGQACPSTAKIGEFRLRSPLFEEWLEGAVYVASPDDPTTAAPGAENPFDSLLALYLVAKLPKRGILVRVAGKITADPTTGRLTAGFDGLPRLPYTDLEMSFRPGQRAFLISPPSCGPAATRTLMSSWGGGANVDLTSYSMIETGIDTGPCPSGATMPFAPDAVAGGVNAHVGSYTPYFVRLSREDDEQEITSYSLVLPKGITGKLAGIPFCPDAAIAAARLRRGVAETAAPSCPQASKVGRTLTGYGVGAALAYAPGAIYLAGPYKGRPLSLVTINAATIGPYDLGTIVIRSAFAIDPYTAQLRIDSRVSDPIPHIIDGIPLHLRDIRVYLDRPQFTHNPSSCAASEMVSTLTGAGARFNDPSDDSTATVARHFQLFNCLTLDFRPKLGLRLRGGSRRGAYPSLRATFASRGAQDSNLKRIEVTMPHSLFLAHNHIREICTRPQFDADRCPAGSVYGNAVAHTPLFDEPLRGPVYLRSSENPLPDLVASLKSGEVRIVLEGRIGPAKQGIRALFDGVPDAPINRFTMTLFGGRRGLLVNSSNICSAPPLASVRALGQNNIGSVFTSRLRGQCAKKESRSRGKGGKR